MPSSYALAKPGEGHGFLSWEFLTSRFEQTRNYWLVTASADGVPHAAPVWGLWLNDAFYFSTDPDSRKGRNIAAGGLAVVHLESGDEAVIIEGHPERVSDRDLLDQLDDLYFRKYDWRLAQSPTYRLKPAKAFAWRESDFTGSATRWRFEG